MGMTIGQGAKRGQVTPQMNVTPLVDVVLVLLIIFMVVTPLLSKQFALQLPKPDTQAASAPDSNKSVVVTVTLAGDTQVNGEVVPADALQDRIGRAMAARPDKVVYFDAADGAPYARTVEAMDVARRGGAKTVAILTKSVVR